MVSSRQYAMLIVNIPARNAATSKLTGYLGQVSYIARVSGRPHRPRRLASRALAPVGCPPTAGFLESGRASKCLSTEAALLAERLFQR
jgi:hypothetical protein